MIGKTAVGKSRGSRTVTTTIPSIAVVATVDTITAAAGSIPRWL